MGLFSSKPTIPPITYEEGVVDWMLKYDDKLEEDRGKLTAEGMEALKKDLLGVLKNCPDSESLKADFEKNHSYYFGVLLPYMAKVSENGGPLPGDDPATCDKLFQMEACLGPYLRIIGYFLLKKYGIQIEA